MPTVRWPWIVPVLCAVAVVVGVVLTAGVEHADTDYLVLDAIVGLTYPLTGALIVTARPRHPVGWLFCLGGAGLALQALAGGYAAFGEVHGWPGTFAAGWLTNWVFLTGFGSLLLLPLYLPDGRLPSSRWRLPAGLMIAALAGLHVVLMLRDHIWVWGVERPNPFGFVPTEPHVSTAFAVVVTVLGIGGAAALATRLRRDLRRLLPVFAAVVTLAAAVVADSLLAAEPQIGVVLLSVALPLVPVATAVSIFRYRLFDIEILLRRTLVYTLLTGLLLAVYLGVVATAHALVASTEALIATAVVAVAFAPLRAALQKAVGRWLFGHRGDPVTALNQLGVRLEAAADPTRLLDDAAETVASSLRLPWVAVVSADGVTVSETGRRVGGAVQLPLTASGHHEGELRAAPRSPGEPLSRADLAVLTDLARHLAVALAAARLAREVRESRADLVRAREEERRRLRRDLHDGLGPGLAAIGIGLYLIEAATPGEEVRNVRELTQTLVADVRRIVQGLRPPALDELGLAGALEDLALDAIGPQVTVTVSDLPELSAAVEVAAYRIVQEALANSLKHARADRIDISATAEAGQLTVTVTDDGCGLPDPLVEGVGSGSMRDRAAELGGTLRRTSTNGTTVKAVLPL
ncbi:sensor histidine kinase [Herbidospora galbida]|uniref:histidine kinase n=1 Tax=Herbidospora galbida TaxID=2575442 RepID=A0A4U3MHZ5_9ACTN|nr:sensor histidine kinase [Herbidospora galbida]TKK88004.1 sensor histidine kinase [Herbidospora galbida]